MKAVLNKCALSLNSYPGGEVIRVLTQFIFRKRKLLASINVRLFCKGLCTKEKIQKSQFTREVGGWVQVSLGFFGGK